jgi:hypothetical protein
VSASPHSSKDNLLYDLFRYQRRILSVGRRRKGGGEKDYADNMKNKRRIRKCLVDA